MDRTTAKELAAKLAAGAVAAGAAIAAQQALEAGYRTRTGHAPPSRSDRDSSLVDVMKWTLVMTATVVVARSVARSGAEKLLSPGSGAPQRV